jgi:hypothetical protein
MSEVGLPKAMPYLSHPLFNEMASWLTLILLSSMHIFEHESTGKKNNTEMNQFLATAVLKKITSGNG